MSTPPPRRPRSIAAGVTTVAVAVALLTGCGDDTTAPPTTAAPTTAPAVGDDEPTTDTDTTDTDAPTTSAPDLAACPDDDPLDGVMTVDVLGDLDGEGADDRIAIGRVGDEWVVSVHLARGGVATGTVPDAGGPVEVAPLGVGELGPDGPVLVVRTGAGAAALIVGVHRLDGCEVIPVRSGPDPARFPIGATVTRADGLACDAERGRLVRRSAESLDGLEFEVVATEYEVVDDELVERDRSTSTVRADEPDFELVAALDCGDAVLG